MNYDRAKQIFTEALKLAPEDRGANLDEQCGEDRELRVQVEALLDHHSTVKDPPEKPTEQPIPGEYQRGDTVGPFTIRERVGGGGMGTVYLASQTSPVRRQVALKVIKPGFDTRNTLARFQAEQQALAMMDHPGIAKVLEAGATESGRPWFAMEYIRGEQLNTYCDNNKLDTRQRLELFIKICEAVQHAHQKGIMHRDLKPSNILVMRDEHDDHHPKVIDFGIAKAVSSTLSDMSLHTNIGQPVGTLPYMSPEQVRGLQDIDTRTDVYTLGVILYELIVGKPPFAEDTTSHTGQEALKHAIREVDPPKPSTQLSSIEVDKATAIATARRTDTDALRHTLRRELEWIPLKALHKDRRDRYSSPEALARDVQRYLDGDALEAGPITRTYRFKKFLKRNKGSVATSASFLVVLISAMVVSLVFWVQAVRNAADLVIANEELKRTKD
ncbi:MAG: serine/threonine-protein kinase, partial [Planctomycetota bacterium]|nr:serine/threonine-protein kinase [Planctomycetota bacterium]